MTGEAGEHGPPKRRRTGRRGDKRKARSWFQPKDHLAQAEVDRGLRMLLFDGISTQVMGALTGGALLVGYALLLGASNKTIGLIAAIPPLTQLLQIPAILLVEKIRRRKLLVVTCTSIGRMFWVVVATIPWLIPRDYWVPTLVASLFLYFSAASLANAAFNSWKRDLLPDAFMARFLASRLTVATAVAAAATLLAGLSIDQGTRMLGDPLPIYSALLLFGGLGGLLGVGFLGRMPEPRMAIADNSSVFEVLAEPLADDNFRKLLMFLAAWNFAVNLAAPFFAVYMLTRLGMPMSWVLGLSVASQIANVGFFRIWGALADRLSNKTVLSLSGSLFVVSIALWPFTTMPERWALTLPLLVVIHLLAGISTAGVNLCAGSITLKLAPRGKATAFLATNALTSGMAATIAPALAGTVADVIARDRLQLQFNWSSVAGDRTLLTALDLSGLDFLFVAAALFGLYALHRLLAVSEEGEIEEGAALELYREVRRTVRNVSTVAGLRRLTYFPYSLLFYRPARGRSTTVDDADSTDSNDRAEGDASRDSPGSGASG